MLETDISSDWGLIVPWEGIKFDQDTHQNIYASGIITQAIDGSYQTAYLQQIKQLNQFFQCQHGIRDKIDSIYTY